MGKRALQLAVLALLGALLGWLLVRPDDPVTPPPLDKPAPKPTVRIEVEPPAQPLQRESSSEFKLPKMAPPVADAAAVPELPSIQVPKGWFIRGSASKKYELRTERDSVFTGNYSARLSSHDKDVQPNLAGSAVQAVLAAPYVGKRVELTAALRTENPMPRGNSVWLYVTDPARVVIAYQSVQLEPQGVSTGEWKRYRVVMDVPWHGEVLAYGFSLEGKGTLWIDDVKLSAVDVAVPVTGRPNNHRLGVIAQAVSLDGALPSPTNLDFEDVLTTRERQPDAPRDDIRGTRF
jgi:hypothetical protein